MTKKTQANRYGAELGDEARERQERLGREYYICCGMPKNGGHHEACSERPEEETGEIHGDQTSLL